MLPLPVSLIQSIRKEILFGKEMLVQNQKMTSPWNGKHAFANFWPVAVFLQLFFKCAASNWSRLGSYHIGTKKKKLQKYSRITDTFLKLSIFFRKSMEKLVFSTVWMRLIFFWGGELEYFCLFLLLFSFYAKNDQFQSHKKLLHQDSFKMRNVNCPVHSNK